MITKAPLLNVEYIGKEKSATEYTPGDFILVSDKTKLARLIQFGQTLRFRNKRFSKWNHTAMIVNPEGELIEANGKNVALAPLSKYFGKEYFLVRINASIEDRHQAVNFALSCLSESYGWVTIASIIFSLLTGLHYSFGFDGQQICSGLVARALERTNFIPPRDASHLTPADLAKLFLEQKTIPVDSTAI